MPEQRKLRNIVKVFRGHRINPAKCSLGCLDHFRTGVNDPPSHRIASLLYGVNARKPFKAQRDNLDLLYPVRLLWLLWISGYLVGASGQKQGQQKPHLGLISGSTISPFTMGLSLALSASLTAVRQRGFTLTHHIFVPTS